MSVQEVRTAADEPFDVAFIQDTQQRRWVIRAPRTEVAAAHMDASLAMLALLVRRVPFAVPAAKGFAPIPKIGRAAVHGYIPGYPLDLTALQPAHPVTAELGRTIAMIHNVDRGLYDEAGLASYDAETYRKRHLAEIDRAAATGRVPAGLLARWEEALDDVRLWRFAPTPVHGALSGSDVLVTFPDRADAARATIRGVTGWEAAKVADPADDFAALVAHARPEVVEAVLTAYAHVRVERPDEHLLARARLVSELGLLATLLRSVGARDEVATEATTARLRRLDDTVHSEAGSRRLRIVPASPVSVGGTPAPSPRPAGSHETPSPSSTSRPAVSGEIPPASADLDVASTAPPAPSAGDDDATDVIEVVATPGGPAAGECPTAEQDGRDDGRHDDDGQNDDGQNDDGQDDDDQDDDDHDDDRDDEAEATGTAALPAGGSKAAVEDERPGADSADDIAPADGSASDTVDDTAPGDRSDADSPDVSDADAASTRSSGGGDGPAGGDGVEHGDDVGLGR